MTDNVTPTQADLIKRLRAEKSKGMLSGCCDTVELVNPDGPEAADAIATQAAEVARLKQELQLYLPPATISGDYGQGWVEGQAWMINCLRGEDAFDKAVPLTHALVKKDAEIARLQEYEALFTALRDQSWDLRCFSIPTGGDDADIGWRVIGHWMAEPTERTIAEVYTDSPAAAVRAALSAQPSEKESFQSRVAEWMLACFGDTIAADQLERADRFTEEALELAQTMPGFNAERAHALVDYVFGRDVGERGQEVGGVMVTLAALCNAVDIDMDIEARGELARIWTKVDAIRAKQAAKPTGSALPVASEQEGGE